jgi:hypothetical protein
LTIEPTETRSRKKRRIENDPISITSDNPNRKDQTPLFKADAVRTEFILKTSGEVSRLNCKRRSCSRQILHYTNSTLIIPVPFTTILSS